MIRILSLIFVFHLFTAAQVQSNLNLINGLVDSSVGMFSKDISAESKVFLNYQSLLGETFFLNRIQSMLSQAGADFVYTQNSADMVLNYTIEDVGVKYNKVFKEGVLEDFSLERSIQLKGSYQLSSKTEMINSKAFTLGLTDTVDYSAIKNIEHPSLAFTQAEIPDEPFWSSLIEPIVAVGAIIVTIFLFFSVRSK